MRVDFGQLAVQLLLDVCAVQPTFARQAAEVKAPQGVGIASVTGYYATAGVLDEETAASAKTERIPTARKVFPMLAAHLGDG